MVDDQRCGSGRTLPRRAGGVVRGTAVRGGHSVRRLGVLFPLPLLLALILLAQPSAATITVAETGQRFRAQVDPHLGKPLWTGYDYFARLQYLSGRVEPPEPERRGGDALEDNEEGILIATPRNNSDSGIDDVTFTSVANLCAPPLQMNLTLTSDGLPVALLVQGGGCATQQKIDTALRYIQPAPLLRFLIINDSDFHPNHRPGVEEAVADGGIRKETVYVNVAPSAAASTGGAQDPPPAVIPIHILHITSHVYAALLTEYLLPESRAADRAAGGPRLTIDSTSSAGYYGLLDGATALWVSLFAICSACGCTALILASNAYGHSQWAAEELAARQRAAAQARQRQQRRRLTREQVRLLLPQYRYDGHELHLVEPHHQALAPSPSASSLSHQDHADAADALREALLAPSAAEPPPAVLQLPLDLDCCSVCLDDYEAGDKVRILPCQHCFHSRCVGRWLAERSATCPLCKTELWADPEERDDEEDGAEEEAPPDPRHAREARQGFWSDGEDSFWGRFFFGSARRQAADGAHTTVEAVNEATQQETAALQSRQPEEDTSADRAGSHSWLRRMFPSHGPWNARHPESADEATETTAMLTERLLATDEEFGQVERTAPEQFSQRPRDAPEETEAIAAAASSADIEPQQETNSSCPQSDLPSSVMVEPTESSPRQVSV